MNIKRKDPRYIPDGSRPDNGKSRPEDLAILRRIKARAKRAIAKGKLPTPLQTKALWNQWNPK